MKNMHMVAIIFLTVIFQYGIVTMEKNNILHLEFLVLQRNIKEFVVNHK